MKQDKHIVDDDIEPAAFVATPSKRAVAMFAPKSRAQAAIGVLALMFLAGSIGFLAGTMRANTTPAGDSADVGFLFDMTAHHEQAVLLAKMQLSRGSDPFVTSMANEIVSLQSYEIGLMRMRLGMWGYEPSERTQNPMTWMGMSMPDASSMPGMASQDELDALRAASGARADELFLALMRDHHLGGVAMAEAAADRAEDPWIIEAASQMARVQASEIAEMDMARDRALLDPAPPGYVPEFADGTAAMDMDMDHTDMGG